MIVVDMAFCLQVYITDLGSEFFRIRINFFIFVFVFMFIFLLFCCICQTYICMLNKILFMYLKIL
jgi:hypothetical protein